jgi:hypothetical protein
VGLSYLLGWALLGVVLSLTVIAGIGPSLPFVGAVALLEVIVCVTIGRRAARVEAQWARQADYPLENVVSGLGIALIAVVAVSGIAVAAATQWNAATEFDAFWFWIPKAETIYYGHGLNAGLWGALPDPARPPLMSVMDAVTFRFTGGVHPSWLVIQRTLLGIAFLLTVATLLGRFVPRWVSFPSVAVLATAPWFWSRLGSPMADLTVTYLITAGALSCMIWLRERRGCWLVIAVVLLAAAALTKSEGQVFAAICILTVLLAGFARYRRAAFPALFLLLALLLIEPWHLWLAHHGLPTSPTMSDFRLGDALHPGFLSGRGFRLTYALQEQQRTGVRLIAAALGGWHTTGLGAWLALPWLVGLAIAVRRAPLLVTATAAWIALTYAGLAVTYWIARPSIYHYMNMTVRRVEPTIVAAAIVLSTLLIGSALRRVEGPDQSGGLFATARSLRNAVAVRRLTFWAMPLAVLALIIAVGDTRPRPSRAGRIDVPALDRELAAQFHNQLVAATYLYDVTAACTGSAPDGLSFACVLSTAGPVGSPPKVLTWNETVTCQPGPTQTQRCESSNGDALD